MAVETETLDDVKIVSFIDRIDSGNAGEAEAAVREALASNVGGVMFDLGRLVYISSAGLRVVLVAAKQLRASQRPMVVCSMAGNVRQVFEISGFLSLLSVYPGRTEALAALRG